MSRLRNYASFFTGFVLLLVGFLSLAGQNDALGVLGNSTAGIFAAYILAFGGLYLFLDSLSEYLVSTGVFSLTIGVGTLVFVLGLLTVLEASGKANLGVTFLSPIVYHVLFMLEGVFLMVACFVME